MALVNPEEVERLPRKASLPLPGTACELVHSALDTCGYGIRATKDLKAHTFVMKYGGDVCNERYGNDWDYYLEHRDGKHWFVGSPVRNSAGFFINSSGIPNCVYVWQRQGDTYWTAVATLRPVKKGEELLCEYYQEMNEIHCNERASLVLRTLHPPPSDLKKDKGVILGTYGTKLRRYYNMRWVTMPAVGKDCWSVACEGQMHVLDYFWLKQENPQHSCWLMQMRPSIVGKKDKKRLQLVDEHFAKMPRSATPNLVTDSYVARQAALKAEQFGVRYDFCEGDTDLCNCEARLRRERGLASGKLSLWEVTETEEVVEIDPPVVEKKKNKKKRKNLMKPAMEEATPPMPSLLPNKHVQKFRAILEHMKKRVDREVVTCDDEGLEAIFEEAFASVDAL